MKMLKQASKSINCRENKLFFRFLKEAGVYTKFLRAVENNDSYSSTLNYIFKGDLKKLLTSSIKSITYIDKCFIWSDTEEGHYFWDKISDRYKEYYNTHRYEKR